MAAPVLLGDVLLLAGAALTLWFLHPFIRSVWTRPMNGLWGFVVARAHKRRALRELGQIYGSKRTSMSPTSASAGSGQDGVETLAREFANTLTQAMEKEFNRQKEATEARIATVQAEIAEVDTRLNALKNRSAQTAASRSNTFLGGLTQSLGSVFTRTTGHDILLLGVALVIVLLDTIIAVEILQSLGLFSESTTVLGFPLKDFQSVIGGFITVTLALFLHVVLGSTPIEHVFSKPLLRHTVAGVTLGIYVVLFLAMVLWPTYAKSCFELILRISWVLGVIALYWLIGRITGDKGDYGRLFLSLVMIAVPILYAVVGVAFVAQILIEKLSEWALEAYLNFRRARLRRITNNHHSSTDGFTAGYWRGRSL